MALIYNMQLWKVFGIILGLWEGRNKQICICQRHLVPWFKLWKAEPPIHKTLKEGNNLLLHTTHYILNWKFMASYNNIHLKGFSKRRVLIALKSHKLNSMFHPKLALAWGQLGSNKNPSLTKRISSIICLKHI